MSGGSRTPDKRHPGERCPACKDAVAALLGRCYGRVGRNVRIEVPTGVADWVSDPRGTGLAAIHAALGHHRGHRDFVRAAHLAPVDFFVPDPGFIVEFDESQHFTAPRAVALGLYPPELAVGFSVAGWRDRCLEIDAHDDEPVYRDEQRAWYDTLRDFAPDRLGLGPTVRLYSREREWCALDPGSEQDVAVFRALIESRRKLAEETATGGDPVLDALIEFEYLANRTKLDYLDACVGGTPSPGAGYFACYGEGDVRASRLLNSHYGRAFTAYLGRTAYVGGGRGSVPFGPLFSDRRPVAGTCERLQALDREIREVARNQDDWLAVLAEYVMIKVSVHELVTDIADAPASYGQPDLAALLELTGKDVIQGTRLRDALIHAHRLGLDPTAEYSGGTASPDRFRGLSYPEFMARRQEWLGTAGTALVGLRERATRDGLGRWISWNKNALCAYDAGPVFLRREHRWLVPDVAAAFAAFDGWSRADDLSETMVSLLSGPVELLVGPYWKRLGGEGRVEDVQQNEAVAGAAAGARAGLERGRTALGLGERPLPSRVGEGGDAVHVHPGPRPGRPREKSTRRSAPSSRDRDPFPLEDLAGQRAVFVESVRRFAENHRGSGESRNRTARRDRCWVDIADWRRLGGERPLYEFDDWIGRRGRDEVTIEFQCRAAPWGAVADAIEKEMALIAAAMPGSPQPNVDTTTSPGWVRFAFAYTGPARPDEIAGGMRVLIDRTRPIVDAWLAEHGNA